MANYEIKSASGDFTIDSHTFTETKEVLVDIPCLTSNYYSDVFDAVKDGNLIIVDNGEDMSNGIPIASRLISLDEGLLILGYKKLRDDWDAKL